MNKNVKKNQKIPAEDVVGGRFKNRTLFQSCDSNFNKSKLVWDMKFFYFHWNFQPH